MAAVLAQMRSDPVTSASGHDLCRAHRIRMISATRISDGSDVIYVDA